MSAPMWVVLEIPKKGWPRVVDTNLYNTWAEAREAANSLESTDAGVRFSVHEVEMAGWNDDGHPDPLAGHHPPQSQQVP